MKRRRFFQSMAAAPAAAALPAAAQSSSPARNADEIAKLAVTAPDAVGDPMPRFFSREEFKAFRKLGAILVPRANGRPGAEEAEAAAFLDFLLSQSPEERRRVYRDGVQQLDQQARSRAGKPFAELTAEEAAPILSPLSEPWTYRGPSDPFARFLRVAKEDFLEATINSRQWAAALSGRSRGAAGMGTYWFRIES